MIIQLYYMGPKSNDSFRSLSQRVSFVYQLCSQHLFLDLSLLCLPYTASWPKCFPQHQEIFATTTLISFKLWIFWGR